MPLISFMMPTFGRAAYEPDVIAEAVYWVLQQRDAEFELVIGNDNPGQTVVCRDPRVRVVNFPHRFSTFGAKLNALLAECRGEIILPQDDDDISLPDRASQALAVMPAFDFWTPGRWWLAMKTYLVRADGNGVAWNCAAFRRAPFLGRYGATYADSDRHVKEWALANVRCAPAVPPPDSLLTYVYRWGTSRYHFSGRADLKAAYDEAPTGGRGTFEIIPTPRVDWPALCRAASPG